MPYRNRWGGSQDRPFGTRDYVVDYWVLRSGRGPEGEDPGRSRGAGPRERERDRDIPHIAGSGQEAWDRSRDERDYRDYGFTHGYWPQDYHEGYGYSPGYRFAHNREGYQEGERHRGRGPKGYRRSDERIREEVSDRLMDDPYLDASDIEVGVQDGEITLSGTVDRRIDKRRAEDIAESVGGVTHVQNNLRPRQSSSG